MIHRLPLVLLALAATPTLAHDPVADLTDAAERFVASLDDKAKAKALIPFDADKRKVWRYTPNLKRPGLRLGDMTEAQKALAKALLQRALSVRGYGKAMAIAKLEAILHDLENKNPIRDPSAYFVMIYGTPGNEKPWGWRFEGHHLSLSYTIVGGEHVSVTPSFFGANPGRVKDGPMKGLRVLGEEEDLGRALVKSLTPEQRAKAILSDKAPRDILTREKTKADRAPFTPIKGIVFEELTEAQRAMMLKLVNVYTGNYPKSIIEAIHKREPITDGEGMRFAWAGGLEPGEGHYYRIQSPAFLIEYDNTQNGASHPHAVWREFDGDFGEDLLRKHYAEHHADDAK